MKSRPAKAFALSNWLLLGNAAEKCSSTVSVKGIKSILCLLIAFIRYCFDLRRQSLHSFPYFFFFSIFIRHHKLKLRKPEQHIFGGFSFQTEKKRKKAWSRKYLYFLQRKFKFSSHSRRLMEKHSNSRLWIQKYFNSN